MENKKILFGSQIQVPQIVTRWAESLKHSAGIYETIFLGRPLYLITVGARPSGGFRVIAERSAREPGTVIFRVEGPSPDEFVIQIITYPYELIFTDTPLRFFRQESDTQIEINPQPSHPL
jgi:hypothetical protein